MAFITVNDKMERSHLDDNFWNITIVNREEYECHGLSKQELDELIQEQWASDYNGIIIGRDVDCNGRLYVFFQDDQAYVAFEDFEKQVWSCSYDLSACEKSDWDELVRLSPRESQEYSFRKCSIIIKSKALQIVEHYLNTDGELIELYLSGVNGKPVV